MRLIFTITLLTLLSGAIIAQDKTAKERNPNSWKQFTSAEGRFTVSLPGPGRPVHIDDTLNTPDGPIKTHSFFLDTDMAFYSVGYSDLPSAGPLTPEQNKEILDGTRKQAVDGKDRVLSESEVSVGGTTGIETLVAGKDVISRSRFVCIDGRLYHLMISVQPIIAFRNGKPSADAKDRTDIFEKTSARFFDSFKIIK
jgi:hypothetical protein